MRHVPPRGSSRIAVKMKTNKQHTHKNNNNSKNLGGILKFKPDAPPATILVVKPPFVLFNQDRNRSKGKLPIKYSERKKLRTPAPWPPASSQPGIPEVAPSWAGGQPGPWRATGSLPKPGPPMALEGTSGSVRPGPVRCRRLGCRAGDASLEKKKKSLKAKSRRHIPFLISNNTIHLS